MSIFYACYLAHTYRGDIINFVTTEGHSIWLKPAEPQYEDLQRLISRLSAGAGTPGFSPHITLLGQLTQGVDQIFPRLETLAASMTSFQVSFSHIRMFDRYFRSVILCAYPNSQLEALYGKAKSLLQVNPEEDYQPHLSLLYSDMETAHKKQLLEGVVIGSPLKVTIHEMVLMHTAGTPNEWQEVATLPLIHPPLDMRLP